MTPLQSAMSLAEEHGIPVFPCRPDKTPYTKNGFKDATTNIDQIAMWWEKYPDALIGVPTGKMSKLMVIDIDPKGAKWYEEHFARLGCGRTHVTPRGHHLVYRMPDTYVRCSVSVIAPGVDVRAEGGYIIWWPAHGYGAVGGVEDLTTPPAFALNGAARPSGKGSCEPGTAHSLKGPAMSR